MEKYKVEIKLSAQKEMKTLSKKDAQRMISKIQRLAEDPRGPDCKKLSSEERYRVRVGQYRILYEIHDPALKVVIVRVAHRRDAYR